MANAAGDPFESVKEEVETTLKTIKNLFANWQSLRKGGAGSSKEELEWTTNELKNKLKSVSWDLEDLEETIKIVEKNPATFKLTGKDIENRKEFVLNTSATVKNIKDQMAAVTNGSQSVNGGGGGNDKKSLLSGVGGVGGGVGGGSTKNKYTKLEEAIEKDNDNFIGGQQAKQELIIKEQDQDLEGLGKVVGRLNEMGQTIHTELVDQGQMIQELDGEVDNTKGRIQLLSKNVQKLLKDSDNKQLCVIACLIIILVILIVFTFLPTQ